MACFQLNRSSTSRNRSAIPDLLSNRTVTVPAKIDLWTKGQGIVKGHLFRPVTNTGVVEGSAILNERWSGVWSSVMRAKTELGRREVWRSTRDRLEEKLLKLATDPMTDREWQKHVSPALPGSVQSCWNPGRGFRGHARLSCISTTLRKLSSRLRSSVASSLFS